MENNETNEKNIHTMTSFFCKINDEKKIESNNSKNTNKINELNENNINDPEKKLKWIQLFGDSNLLKKKSNDEKKNEKDENVNLNKKDNNTHLNEIDNNVKNNINEKINNNNSNNLNNKKESNNEGNVKIIIEEDSNKFNVEVKLIENEKIYIGNLILLNFIIKFEPNKSSKEFFHVNANKIPSYYEFSIFLLDKIKIKDNNLTIILKDRRILNFSSDYSKKLEYILKSLRYLDNIIKYYHYAFFYKRNSHYKTNKWDLYDIEIEFCRQNLDFEKYKITLENKNYTLCKTYPKFLIIPKLFQEKYLNELSSFRSKNRFPVLTYYYSKGKNGIFRSSQCLSGLTLKKSNLEILYFNLITEKKKMLNIYDLRSKTAAVANKLKGGGCDDPSIYDNCTLDFCDLENIHMVRKSFKKFLNKKDNKDWIKYISQIILTSINICSSINKGNHVLIHCSDGWDRTTQVCCLIQIFLDPFYRTLNGFGILIEKEFVSFGHQFALRNGCYNEKKENDMSPIFIQFLFCVYQLINQFPTCFEFNENLLLFLSNEIYKNKYGNFLFNCELYLNMNSANELTVSIWTEILENKYKYFNPYYVEYNGIIIPKYEIEFIDNWINFVNYYEKIGGLYYKNKIVYKNEILSIANEDKGKAIEEVYNFLKSKGLDILLNENTKKIISKYQPYN